MPQRLLGKPDKMLEDKIRSLGTLPALCKDLLHVVTRRDGNPFSLTRLLCVPGVFRSLLLSDPKTGYDAISFLTFGLLQFDNPMFTEDAVQVPPQAPTRARPFYGRADCARGPSPASQHSIGR